MKKKFKMSAKQYFLSWQPVSKIVFKKNTTINLRGEPRAIVWQCLFGSHITARSSWLIIARYVAYMYIVSRMSMMTRLWQQSIISLIIEEVLETDRLQ